jgi:hypothetical protein
MSNANDEVSILLSLIQSKNREIIHKRSQIKDLMSQIRQIEKNMMIICQHQWVRDYDDPNEHPQYTCTICDLSRP